MVLSTAPPRHIAKATPDDILRIADRLEPGLRRSFLAAFETLSTQLPVNEITDLIEAGRTIPIIDMVRGLTLPADVIAETQAVLVEALTQAANVEGVGFGLSFNLTNPAAVRYAETQTGQLITEVTRETQKAVADIVRRGIVEGIPPRTQARSIRRIVGLTARDAAAVDRFLTGMLEDDISLSRAESMADRMRNRLLRRRAENIARTETLTAANRGQYQAWQEAADAGLINIQTTEVVWIATEDDRTCPICAVLDGETVGFGQTFTSNVQATGFDIKPASTLEGTPQFDIEITGTKPLKEPVVTLTPPAHPSCRCTLGLETSSTTQPTSTDWPIGDDDTRWYAAGVPDNIRSDTVPNGFEDWVNQLSDEDKAAIDRYTAGGYRNLNEKLRDLARDGDELFPPVPLTDEETALMRRLDRLVNDADHIDTPWVTYRGVTTTTPSGPLSGISDDEMFERVADAITLRHTPGTVIDMGGGFVSTSVDVQPALDAALSARTPGVIYEIQARAGAYLQGASQYDDEFELLLGRDSTFEVVNVLRRVPFETDSGNIIERTVVQLRQL